LNSIFPHIYNPALVVTGYSKILDKSTWFRFLFSLFYFFSIALNLFYFTYYIKFFALSVTSTKCILFYVKYSIFTSDSVSRIFTSMNRCCDMMFGMICFIPLIFICLISIYSKLYIFSNVIIYSLFFSI
jgi:hypothetical protein